jgi:hypothetical protein
VGAPCGGGGGRDVPAEPGLVAGAKLYVKIAHLNERLIVVLGSFHHPDGILALFSGAEQAAWWTGYICVASSL